MTRIGTLVRGVAAPLLLSLLGSSAGAQTGAESAQGPVGGREQKNLPANEQTSKDDSKLAHADYTVVNFSAGSSQLSEPQKNAIKQALLGRPEKEGVKLAVWSDKGWTPEQAGNASYTNDDKKLAEQRGKALKEYISEVYPKKDVEVYTMTEKVGFFARLFNTEEAEIKSIFAKKGAAHNNMTASEVLRDHGGASKAVLLITQD